MNDSGCGVSVGHAAVGSDNVPYLLIVENGTLRLTRASSTNHT